MKEKQLDLELVKSSMKLLDEGSFKVYQLGLLVRNLGTAPEFENTKPVKIEEVQAQAKYIGDELLSVYEDLADSLDAIHMQGGIKYDR